MKIQIEFNEISKFFVEFESSCQVLDVDFGEINSVGELVSATSVTVTPSLTSQDILPSDLGAYNYISEVIVNPISKTEVENEAGGITVTIGSAA